MLLNENINAPEFVGLTNWLNLKSGKSELKLSDLRGNAVLVDFWTYTCINCIRTLPFITSWYEKYKDQGFVVVGVHTPEFEFEKKSKNVTSAVKRFGINYPVAQDNNYATWNSYANHYWPAEYLIDTQGKIRRIHFGEGEYDKTEMTIQLLLKRTGKRVDNGLICLPDQTPRLHLSPETYLGSERMAYYFPGGNVGNGTDEFDLTEYPERDSFSLGGRWTITEDRATAKEGSVLTYNFYAEKVFLVMHPTGNKVAKIEVFLDNDRVAKTDWGKDVKGGVATINSDRLYNLIDLKGAAENHILKLVVAESEVELFAFTFG